jgi:hypothetical protein
MAPLRNTKHELFAQGLAEGKSMTEAYRAAGYTNRSHASRLVAKGTLRGVWPNYRTPRLPRRK